MKRAENWLSKVTQFLAIAAGLAGICILFVSLSATAAAQNDVGSIVGFITDQTGAVIPGAQVTIQNEGTGETRRVVSDASGHYAVPNLQPAVYTMTAEAKGFQKFVSSQNTLSSNSTIQINGKLSVGQASQTVTVSSTAEVLQTQSPAIQAEVTGTQIQKEELNGRNPIYMAQLLPGVVSTATMADLNFNFNNGDTFEVNGARGNDTKYTIDGAMASRTRGDSQIIAGANVDSVQEMQVLTGDYSAEYGSASGAQVRIITKSGTRDFHGSLYEYIRNADLNANTWSLNHAGTPRQQFQYNNFGFALGGPLWAPKVPVLSGLRDKFFFFVNEDWVIFRQQLQQLMAVPTLRMRGGDFSELLSSSSAVNPWYKAGTVVIDPATGLQADYNGQPNVLPPGELSANGVGIMKSYPMPNLTNYQGTSNWSGTAGQPQNQRKGQINGDLILGNHHIEFRRSDDSYTETAPYNQSNPLVPLLWSRPNQDNSLGWIWTINPTTINEAWTSMSIDDVYINADPIGQGYNRTQYGINFPYIIPGYKNEANRIPTANMNDSFSNIQGGPYPSHSSGIIYQDSDSITKVMHNHTVKGGFFYTFWGENDNDQINVSTVPGGASNQNGTFSFSDNHNGIAGGSGVSMANLALGLADAYTEIGTKAFTMWRGRVFEYFGQDNWQLTHKLNVSYGVRGTSTIPEHGEWGNTDFFDPPSYSASSAPTVTTTGLVVLGTGNAYDGMVIPGFSGFPSSAAQHGVAAATASNNLCAGTPCTTLFAPNLPKQYVAATTQFQPRLGFAYQMFPTAVLRAGVGRFVSNKGLLDNVFPGGNSPFQPTESVNNVAVDNPGASITTGVEAPLLISSLNRHLVPPTRWNWNVTVEEEIPRAQSVVQVAYVGARGLHNWDTVDINQVPAGTVQANPPTDNINYLRPYKGYSSIQQEQSGVSSSYNSLQASWNSRFRGGSLFGVSYTWSKSMDESSNYRDIVPDSFNTSNLWAPSEYDIPQALTVNYLWAEPFFANKHNLLGEVAGGWQFAGNVQAQKGEPCGIGTNTDYAGVGEVGSFGCGSQGQFWVMSAAPKHLGGFAGFANSNGAKYFSTTDSSGNPLFTKPAAGTFNLQHGVRNSVRESGIENWNLSMIKAFPVTESTGFEFRAEAFNFINHPNWSNPNLNPTSGTFGEVTGKNGNNRNLQFGLRFHF